MKNINCRNATTGGVECYCAKAGLHFQGSRDDGTKCIEPTSTQLDLQSTELTLTIRKPKPSAPLKMILRARGGTAVGISFSFLEFLGSDTDLQLVQTTHSMKQLGSNGLHLSMLSSEPLLNETSLNPRGGLQQFTWNFEVTANCSFGLNRSACRKDGDAARTVVSMDSTQENGLLLERLNISFTAKVEAMPSCELVRARASISTAVLEHLSKTGLTATVPIVDVDGLAIDVTRQHTCAMRHACAMQACSTDAARSIHRPLLQVLLTPPIPKGGSDSTQTGSYPCIQAMPPSIPRVMRKAQPYIVRKDDGVLYPESFGTQDCKAWDLSSAECTALSDSAMPNWCHLRWPSYSCLYSYGICSYRLCSNGLYSYGLYRYSHHIHDFMAC